MLWQGHSSAVRSALRAADPDPDPFRDAVRAAWAAGPAAAGGAVAALAGRAGAGDQPPGFVAVFGGDETVPAEARRGLLGAAVGRRPVDLGLLLAMGNTYPLGRRDGADERARWCQAAVAAAPGNPVAHSNLGNVLLDRRDLDGAEREYREAVRLDPNYANAHNGLGWVLQRRGDLDGAVAEYTEALRLDPKQAFAAVNLPRAERMRALLPRLPGALAGTDKPATAKEALGFAELCRQPFQKQFAAAVRFYESAFALDPALATDWRAAHAYYAAAAAARAARGDGADAPADPGERAALRAKALGWLRGFLAVRRTQAASTAAADRAEAVRALTYWLGDADLAGTRPGLWRIGMTFAERKEWDAFWADVKATLVEAQKQK